MQKNYLKIIFISSTLIFLFFAFYSYFSNVKDYINDSFILIFLTTIVYSLKKQLNLTPLVFIILIFAMITHVSGVFGFYNTSPILIQYDHFTHFIGIFAVSLLFFNFLKKYFTNPKLNNLLIFLIIILASIGIGSLIEQIEYLGFLKFGTGQGFLKFGGLGDTVTEDTLRDIDLIGGGWINTMEDLIYNFLGALFGTTFMYILYLYKKKNDSKKFEAM